MKVNDKVAYLTGYHNTRWKISTIIRETKTQFILDNGLRYRKDTLRKIGGRGGKYSDSHNYIRELTDEILNKIKLHKKLSIACELMHDLGEHRNRIQTKNIKDVGIAIGKMIEVKNLLGILNKGEI
jgi:hypothetical protein